MISFNSIHKDILDFIYPRTCIVSGKRLDRNNSNNYINDEVLASFPEPSEDERREFRIKIKANHVYSLFTFTDNAGIQHIIHNLKYGKMKGLAVFMGELLGKALNKKFTRTVYQFDYIVPVPLFKLKERERGYNQSLHISEGIKKTIELDINPLLVKRILNTKTQAKLNKEMRAANVLGAFEIYQDQKYNITGKDIMIIDDVMTTGATINEVIKVLKEAGANKIFVATLALAAKDNLDRI